MAARYRHAHFLPFNEAGLQLRCEPNPSMGSRWRRARARRESSLKFDKPRVYVDMMSSVGRKPSESGRRELSETAPSSRLQQPRHARGRSTGGFPAAVDLPKPASGFHLCDSRTVPSSPSSSSFHLPSEQQNGDVDLGVLFASLQTEQNRTDW